eukprot:gnl/TRDRNA2_/TRDRNA2_174013_c0_seq1.p1 gnl/TRDRNA2_/TRDRNA2_174013_c0~~gnl/TRDRNA2_/TRDRNA2_174013_c0_seq1.p1  ORF type:complete len:391 (+),score=38.23 gnl/TRDRNA2_/TRDRNA2_174013_c0_seq1:95-1267(+)
MDKEEQWWSACANAGTPAMRWTMPRWPSHSGTRLIKNPPSFDDSYQADSPRQAPEKIPHVHARLVKNSASSDDAHQAEPSCDDDDKKAMVIATLVSKKLSDQLEDMMARSFADIVQQVSDNTVLLQKLRSDITKLLDPSHDDSKECPPLDASPCLQGKSGASFSRVEVARQEAEQHATKKHTGPRTSSATSPRPKTVTSTQSGSLGPFPASIEAMCVQTESDATAFPMEEAQTELSGSDGARAMPLLRKAHACTAGHPNTELHSENQSGSGVGTRVRSSVQTSKPQDESSKRSSFHPPGVMTHFNSLSAQEVFDSACVQHPLGTGTEIAVAHINGATHEANSLSQRHVVSSPGRGPSSSQNASDRQGATRSLRGIRNEASKLLASRFGSR